jgi:hypothetical protein
MNNLNLLLNDYGYEAVQDVRVSKRQIVHIRLPDRFIIYVGIMGRSAIGIAPQIIVGSVILNLKMALTHSLKPTSL